MEENKLAARIRPLETFAAKKPSLYRCCVALVAALGYLYLLTVVLLLLAVVAVSLYYGHINYLMIKVLWIPLVLAGLVLRSLWVTIPVPDGKELHREQAPPLFALIDEVREALSGPKVHHVFVSDEFNASIVQIPSLGMFGWLSNYLVVGLPLLTALSPKEFHAVLAHEFGHLSGRHGRFSGWIYRVRQTWIQILTQVREERSYASFLFEPFLKWYAPYLNAYSFVLARAQEREADSYSVDLAGKNVAAITLIRMMAKERGLMEDFWPNFFRQSREQAQAPKDPFVQMLSGLDQSIGQAKAQRWFLQALRVPTGYDDTHPALADRLAAIGFARDSPEMLLLLDSFVEAEDQESAATYYLKELPEDFLPGLNRLWRERIVKSWHECHEQSKTSERRLAELDGQAALQPLTSEQQWERVAILSQLRDRAATVPEIKKLLTDDPKHGRANFALGVVLLEQGDATGVEYLEKAMELSPDVTGEACEMISGFYLEQGDKNLAEVFRSRADQVYEQEQKRQEQLLNFTPKDRFEPHGLDEELLKDIQNQLATVRGLGAAYLVRKVIEASDEPIYVLGILCDFTWQNGRNEKHPGLVMEELVAKASLLPPGVFVALDVQPAFLSDNMSKVAGAQIFALPDFGVTQRY